MRANVQRMIVELPKPLHAQLKAAAEEQGESVVGTLRGILREALGRANRERDGGQAPLEPQGAH